MDGMGPITELSIATPGTCDDMVKAHGALPGFKEIFDLDPWTMRYTRNFYKVLQADLNKLKKLGPKSREIVKAVDKDATKLSSDMELWRSLKHPQGAAARQRYQKILDAKVGTMLPGDRLPFSTSTNPVISAGKYGIQTADDGTKTLGVVIKIRAKKGTPAVIMNPYEAEVLIGSGHGLQVERIGRNVRVKFQDFKSHLGTAAKVEEVVADRVIYATIEKVRKPSGL